MTFWILIAMLALAVGAILTWALLRGRTGGTPAAAYDLKVYRDQLKEVDRDLARGVIDAADAERVRNEVSRRILAADAQLQAGPDGAGRTNHPALALALIGLTLGGALALYTQIGAPGYSDLPMAARIAASDQARATRLSQAEAEAKTPALPPAPEVSQEYLSLMEKLRDTVASRPDDLRGLRLLVRNETSLGNVAAAHRAQSEVIRVKGDAANAADYALLADLMIAAAGGYVSTEAEAALRRTLELDPAHPTSRYYLGAYMMQVDRPDAAFRIWQALLRDSPAGAPWVLPVRDQIEEAAWRAGVTYTLPPLPGADGDTPMPGPSPDEIEAAQQMSAQERQDMIRAMVSQLATRVENEAVPPADWARLITAYGVLGESELAQNVWENAQKTFWDAPDALDLIRHAAQQAGVAQ